MGSWRKIVLKAIRGTHLGSSDWLSSTASYLVAALAALAAALARYELDPMWGAKTPYITFYPAVALAAWLGGLGPGLLATAISTTCALLFLAV